MFCVTRKQIFESVIIHKPYTLTNVPPTKQFPKPFIFSFGTMVIIQLTNPVKGRRGRGCKSIQSSMRKRQVGSGPGGEMGRQLETTDFSRGGGAGEGSKAWRNTKARYYRLEVTEHICPVTYKWTHRESK